MPARKNRIVGYIETNSVYVDGIEVDLASSLKVLDKSPAGFAWGYAGSGPSQLALAILMVFTDDKTAKLLYQQFKIDVIAPLPWEKSFIIEFDIPGWIEMKKREQNVQHDKRKP